LVAAWDSYANEASGYELRIGIAGNSAMSMKPDIEKLAQQLYDTRESRESILVGQDLFFG